jgi:hypothetical protein
LAFTGSKIIISGTFTLGTYMAQRTNLDANKHICIYEMERDGGSFTGDVVCMICGVKLSADNKPSVTGDTSPENPRHL